MQKLLRHSHFNSDPWGDGGSKRTAQISEILTDAGLPYEFYNPDITQIFKKRFAALEGLRLLNLHKIQSSLNKTALTQLGFNYYKRQETMRYYASSHKVLLWESNRQQNFLMSYAARDTGFKVLGLPHNLESLVQGQKSDFTGKEAPYWFEEELQSLRQCHRVFTISREEQYLLKLFGFQADFLPYYPPKEVVTFLQEIRARRQLEAKKGMVLLLGTAGNKPTFDGMVDRIRFFHKYLRNKGLILHVAGYLTENLVGHIPADTSICLHGSVSNLALADLLANASFCWIHQTISTGSLTKIPELMLAGVPVLLNSDAARNFHNIPGVEVYENDEDCIARMPLDMPVPQPPAKPLVFEKHLIEAIKELNLQE